MIHPAWFRTSFAYVQSGAVQCAGFRGGRAYMEYGVLNGQRFFYNDYDNAICLPLLVFLLAKYPGYIIIVTCAHDIMRMTDTDTDTNTDTSRADRVE